MLEKTNFKIGLDVGSTTIKCVVLKDDEIIFKSYQRHKEMVKEKAKGGILDIFTNISEWFNERKYKDDNRKF